MKEITRRTFLMEGWDKDLRSLAEFITDLGERIAPSVDTKGIDPSNAIEWIFFPLDGKGSTPDKETAIQRNMAFLDELVEVEEESV